LSAGSRNDKLPTIAPKNSMVSGSPGCISGNSTCFASVRWEYGLCSPGYPPVLATAEHQARYQWESNTKARR
jgi:hypothetical protein